MQFWLSNLEFKLREYFGNITWKREVYEEPFLKED